MNAEFRKRKPVAFANVAQFKDYHQGSCGFAKVIS